MTPARRRPSSTRGDRSPDGQPVMGAARSHRWAGQPAPLVVNRRKLEKLTAVGREAVRSPTAVTSAPCRAGSTLPAAAAPSYADGLTSLRREALLGRSSQVASPSTTSAPPAELRLSRLTWHGTGRPWLGDVEYRVPPGRRRWRLSGQRWRMWPQRSTTWPRSQTSIPSAWSPWVTAPAATWPPGPPPPEAGRRRPWCPAGDRDRRRDEPGWSPRPRHRSPREARKRGSDRTHGRCSRRAP